MKYAEMYQKLCLYVPDSNRGAAAQLLEAMHLDRGAVAVVPRFDQLDPLKDEETRLGPDTAQIRILGVQPITREAQRHLSNMDIYGANAARIEILSTSDAPGLVPGKYACLLKTDGMWFFHFPDEMFEDADASKYFATWELCDD